MSWRIERYSPEKREVWNAFVAESRNATFLFDRGYMDYHADRFVDCSWMAYKGNRLLALLPANLTSDGLLHSHGGLTYGGWILPPAHIDGADLLEIFRVAVSTWHQAGIRTLDYKPLPWFYASQPSQEDEYALFRLGAELAERSLSATIDLRNPVGFNKMQTRHLKKASELDLTIEEGADVDCFMAMLAECLRDRHDTTPVHTASEMQLLISRFPENIRIFVVKLDDMAEAGVCIYDTRLVAHAQYIATTEKGRELNLLSPLFDYLLRDRYKDRRYFDFGISNEDHGRYLNSGLLRQKYSYGATGTVHSRYSLDLTRCLNVLNDQ